MPATRARLGVIFFTVFIDLVGFGIVLPILPYYAQSFGARGLLFGALVGAYSGMQFLATAVLGLLSDCVGRRPILLISLVINAVRYPDCRFHSHALARRARSCSTRLRGSAGARVSSAGSSPSWGSRRR